MSDSFITAVTAIAALGSAVVAGFFFAFSAVTMQALGLLPPAYGIAAMQSINVVVLNRWFFAAFFGTAGACSVLLVYALLRWSLPVALELLVGSALYLLGVIGVTIACNVPLNNALAAVDPGSSAGEQLWSRYLATWTAWNHVRTVAPLLAAVVLAATLR